LNEFQRRYARKSHGFGGAKTFLAIDDADNKNILGFYSLTSASADLCPDTRDYTARAGTP
jgi:hypothetical protein